ncbi:MAG: TonB family protein [Gammaproteobacteria bacterium]|nr:TonB family protein [Gammaproteobacteria bacterium]
MAVDSLNTGTSSRAENFREIFEEFLAARVNLQLVLDAMTALLDENPDYSEAIQSELDAALESGRLPEQTWERLSAEFDHLISEDDPTEWSMDMPGPQFAGFEPDDEPQAEPSPPPAPAQPVQARPEPPILTEPATPEPPVLTAAAPQPSPAPSQTAPAAPQTAAGEPTETEPVHGQPGQGTALEPGSLLNDRYVLVSQVVSGAMGDIYKALDRQRKEAGVADPWVAIKVINAQFAARPDALQALKNEVELCLRLDHPNVVRVFGMEQHNQLSFITMEWVDGESLVDVLKRTGRKPLPEAQAHRILDGVSSALEHVHAMDVVHADVKPGNVLLTRDGQPKLIDFGIARRMGVNDDGFDSAQLGARTPGYCSPEVLEGKPITTADEVFSLALLVYRVMSGTRAFGDSNALEAEVAGQRPARIEGLSDARWAILDRALAFRRADRTGSVGEFRAEFFAPETEEITEEIVLESPEPVIVEPAPEPDPVVATPEIAEPAPVIADDDATDINQSIDFDTEGEIQRPPLWRRPVVLAAAATMTAAAIGLSLFMGGETESPPPFADAQPDRLQPPPTQMQRPAPFSTMGAGLAQETELREVIVRAYMRPDVFAPDIGTRPEPTKDLPDTVAVTPPAVVTTGPEPKPAPQQVEPAPPPPKPAPKPEPVRAAAPKPPPEPKPAVASAPESAPAPKQVQPAPPPPQPEPAPAVAKAPGPAPEPTAAPAAQDRGDPPTTETGSLVASTTAMAMVAPETADSVSSTKLEETGPPTPVRAKPQPAPGEIGPLPPPGPGTVALSKLEFRKFSEPRYPRRLAAKRIEGWVAVEFLVDEKGETSDVRILDADPPELFNAEAVAAVERWRFKPYIVDGEPTATYSQVRLRFDQ